MKIFSAFTKVKGLIPFTKGNVSSAASESGQEGTIQKPISTATTQALQIHRVQVGRVGKSPTKRSQGKSKVDPSHVDKWLEETEAQRQNSDLEGDTLLNDNEGSADSTTSVDDTLAVEEVKGQIQMSDRFINYQDPKYADWAREEVWLFNKLSKRGLEPLLRDEWQLDFLSFPDDLFSKNEKLVFVNNLNTEITEATNELVVLIDSGPRCRDALLFKKRPEPALKRGIERYKKWSVRDARMQRKPHLDLITIAAAGPGESVASVVSRITEKFQLLGQQWRDMLRQPSCSEDDENSTYIRPLPTLYGFIIKYTVVAVMTFDASSPTSRVRSLVTLDHSKDGQDVWHSLAIGIVCCRARNILLELEREGLIGEEKPDDDDPDA